MGPFGREFYGFLYWVSPPNSRQCLGHVENVADQTAHAHCHRRFWNVVILNRSERCLDARNLYRRLCGRRRNHCLFGIMYSDPRQDFLDRMGRCRVYRIFSHHLGRRLWCLRSTKCRTSDWSFRSYRQGFRQPQFRRCHQRSQHHHLRLCRNTMFLQHCRRNEECQGLHQKCLGLSVGCYYGLPRHRIRRLPLYWSIHCQSRPRIRWYLDEEGLLRSSYSRSACRVHHQLSHARQVW